MVRVGDPAHFRLAGGLRRRAGLDRESVLGEGNRPSWRGGGFTIRHQPGMMADERKRGRVWDGDLVKRLAGADVVAQAEGGFF